MSDTFHEERIKELLELCKEPPYAEPRVDQWACRPLRSDLVDWGSAWHNYAVKLATALPEVLQALERALYEERIEFTALHGRYVEVNEEVAKLEHIHDRAVELSGAAARLETMIDDPFMEDAIRSLGSEVLRERCQQVREANAALQRELEEE